MSQYDYFQPESLEEAFRLKKEIPNSLFISGGTDLMVRINKREIHPHALISLRSIPALSGVENGKIILIGGMTSISDILKNSLLHEKYPVLIQAAKALGNEQIRNVATIGGNLCNGSPAADMAPPLLVLEAKVQLQSTQDSRDLTLEKFFRGSGETYLSRDELLTGILLDPTGSNTKTIFLKKGRTKMDLAVASVATLIRAEGNKCLKARVAAGSVAPTPLRLFEVEALLEGSTLTQDLLNEAQQLAAKSVSPISDIRSTSDNRRHLVGVLVKRALESLLTGESGDKEFRDRYRT
ncbi:MAG: xanthine dehydrogenase family protein subunit M [Candidatus Aminicenantes bacterium]|nr:MAG: xanthine dehydrogenase family protein subunit M [Candidatus Aminicenantes bacterium]